MDIFVGVDGGVVRYVYLAAITGVWLLGTGIAWADGAPLDNTMPTALIGNAANLGFGIMISWMWSNDSKRKDDLLKEVMKEKSQETSRLLDELSRIIQSQIRP